MDKGYSFNKWVWNNMTSIYFLKRSLPESDTLHKINSKGITDLM